MILSNALAVSFDTVNYATIVDEIDEQAELFNEQYGFSRLSVESRRFFLSLKSFSARIQKIPIFEEKLVKIYLHK